MYYTKATLRKRQIRGFNDRRIYTGKAAPAYYQKLARLSIGRFAKTFKSRMAYRKAKRPAYHQRQAHFPFRPKRTRRQRAFTPFKVKYNY